MENQRLINPPSTPMPLTNSVTRAISALDAMSAFSLAVTEASRIHNIMRGWETPAMKQVKAVMESMKTRLGC